MLDWIRRVGAVAFVSLLLAIAPETAEAKWQKAETLHFVVYGDGSQDTLRSYAERLELFDTVLRYKHGMKIGEAPLRKLTIYLVRNHNELQRAAPWASESVAGFYSASTADVFAVAIRDRGDDIWSLGDDIILHEYAHHFMLAHFPYGYPAWLTEGYAEYFATAELKVGQAIIGKHNRARGFNLLNGDWIAFEDLLTKSGHQFRLSEDRAMYYAQSWLLTHWFMSDSSRYLRFQKYLQELGRGADSLSAFKTATGYTPEQLGGELRKYLRSALPFIRYDGAVFAKAEVSLSPAPPSADEILLDSLHIKRGVSEKDRPGLLKKTQAVAKRYPDDAFAQLTHARAEIGFGDRHAGEAVLKKLLADDPGNIDALVLMAESRMDSVEESDAAGMLKGYREARAFAGRAVKADQTRFEALYAYVRTRAIEPTYPTDNDLEALLAAHEAAPQVAPIRWQAASALMTAERYEFAAHLLQPLANNPHGGEMAEAARKLMQEAKGKAGSAAE